MVWLSARALAGARRHSDGTAGAAGRGKDGQAWQLWALPGGLSERWPAAMVSDVNKDSNACRFQGFRCRWVARISPALRALCASRCLMCSFVAGATWTAIK